MDVRLPVSGAALRLVRVASWLVPLHLRAEWRARMARRAGGLGRRRSGRGHSPRPRRVRRRLLAPPAAVRRSPLGRRPAPRLAATARPRRIRRRRHRHPGARHGRDRSPHSASSRRSCCGRCRIPNRIGSSRCGSGSRRPPAGSTSRRATSSTGATARRRSRRWPAPSRTAATSPTASGPRCGACST